MVEPLAPAELQALQQQLGKLGPAATFPWHVQQEYALRAATDVVCILGGNRSGKSQAALGIVSRLIRREGPIYSRLRKPKGRALRIWVSPVQSEKFRSVWAPRLRQEAFKGLDFDVRQAPEHVFTWHDEQGGGTLWAKSVEQGALSFESDEVDLVVFDEEPPDPQVYSSACTRFATTNGVVVLAFTPLAGLSWTYDQIVAPVMKDENKIADRVWRSGHTTTLIQMGMSDNSEAVAGGGVVRIQNDMSMGPAEKNARLFGTYGFTEGLLIPSFATLKANDPTCPYIIDKLPSDRPYSWLMTLDPNKKNAGLLMAFDHEGNRYVVDEHYAENIPDSQHARAYGRMLARRKLSHDDVEIWADPGGAGGQAILNIAELGFFARAVPKGADSVAASIKLLRRQAWIDPEHMHPVTKRKGAPRLYFLSSLCSSWRESGVDMEESRLLWELRQYRQKPEAAPDTPIKKKDDATDCLRYAELVRMAEPEMVMADPVRQARASLDTISRGEAEDFDKMLDAMERKGQLKRSD